MTRIVCPACAHRSHLVPLSSSLTADRGGEGSYLHFISISLCFIFSFQKQYILILKCHTIETMRAPITHADSHFTDEETKVHGPSTQHCLFRYEHAAGLSVRLTCPQQLRDSWEKARPWGSFGQLETTGSLGDIFLQAATNQPIFLWATRNGPLLPTQGQQRRAIILTKSK